MAENYFKVRNTYLGIDGSQEESENNENNKYSKRDSSGIFNILDHSDNMHHSLNKNSGNNCHTNHRSPEEEVRIDIYLINLNNDV